jgi:hypothetical protein
MRMLFPIIFVLLAACAPSAEPIEPEPDRRELGQQSPIAVTIPLSWHASEHWQIDPLFGAASRGRCGNPEADLFPLGIEIDAASVPSGSAIVGATLVIDPCDEHTALPDNLPVFAVFAVDRFGVATQTASAAQDQSPNALAYNSMHEIVASPLDTPVVVGREKNRYMVLFEPEYGNDATGGTRVNGLVLDVLLP